MSKNKEPKSKWEYKVAVYDSNNSMNMENFINLLAKEGWEFCGLIDSYTTESRSGDRLEYVFLFSRVEIETFNKYLQVNKEK